MIATFLDDKGGSIAYSVGKEITLQDALNATQNNHFAPSIVVLTGVKNEQAQAEKTPETIESTPEPKLGKHTIEDIIAKHKISSAKLTDLLTEGADHELEHTNSYKQALAIATDHIYEHLDYYKRLKQVNLAYGGLLKHKKETLPAKPIEIEVFVPSTDLLGEKIEDVELASRITSVTDYFNRIFGGSITDTRFGGFQNQNGEVVNETIVCIKAYSTNDAWEKNKRRLVNKIAEWAFDWGQESVGFEHNNTLYFVSSHYADELGMLENVSFEEI